jgi:hypothetical protein
MIKSQYGLVKGPDEAGNQSLAACAESDSYSNNLTASLATMPYSTASFEYYFTCILSSPSHTTGHPGLRLPVGTLFHVEVFSPA